MDQQTNYIVFQCYGNEGVFYECAYALLSLSQQYSGEVSPEHLQIWIYTDNKDWFSILSGINLPLNFRTIDNIILQQWRGKIDFVHRVKIEVLRDFTKDRNGNVLYVDTDVAFTQKVDSMFGGIGEGKLYMHVMEGIVSERGNPILAKLDAYLEANVPLKVNGIPVRNLAMWNAGVLGFNTRYSYLLDEVLLFTDTEYPRFPKHIIEQFAFSVYFRQAADIKTAAAYMVHYWNLKEARNVLMSFFTFFKDKPFEEMAQGSVLIQIHVLLQQKMNYTNNRSFADKVLNKHWQPAVHNWEELMKQL
jgi:hypothetical protein